MERLYAWLDARRNWRWIGPAVIACAGCIAAFWWRGEVLPGASPDARRCGYLPAEVAKYLDDAPEDCRWLYPVSEVTLDFVFPLFYGALLGWLIVWLYARPNALLLLGFLSLGVACDYGENVTLAGLAWTFETPQSPAWVMAAQAASWVTILKWVALNAVGLAVVPALCCRVIGWLFRDQPPKKDTT